MFDISSEKIKREHVKNQVRIIGMKHSIGEKSIPFSALHGCGTKNKSVHHRVVAECADGNNRRYSDNKVSNHVFFERKDIKNLAARESKNTFVDADVQ